MPNWDEEHGAFGKLTQIHIARMWSRGYGAGDARTQWWKVAVRWRHPECALKGLERHADVGRKRRPHVLQIERQIFDLPLRKILCQQAGP